MDAASGSQPARGDGDGIAHPVIIALLTEVHPDRIVVGDRTLFLRKGQNCLHALGTNLEVVYTEQGGRSEVERITPLKLTR
jgi:hypothetical protein